MYISALAIVAACSWNNPGANPYMGNVPDAVYSYSDIPRDVQDKLHARMVKHDYDDIVTIGVENIVGASTYTDLRQMHFGDKKLCGQVDRSKWVGRQERGLVYCEGEHCLIVPTVCRNVSRITKVVDVPKHIERLEEGYRTEEERRLRELLKEKEKEKVHTVPEPSTLLLILAALGCVALTRKRHEAP